MSVHSDEAMDLAYHPQHLPTEREEAWVRAFQFGHRSLDWLWTKLGSRALYVCAHFGITSTTPGDLVRPGPVDTEDRPADPKQSSEAQAYQAGVERGLVLGRTESDAERESSEVSAAAQNPEPLALADIPTAALVAELERRKAAW
jgi:hypothetical protein